MSAVDAPPGIAFAGEAAGEFVSQPRSRRLAARVFGYVVVVAAATFVMATRRLHVPMIEFLLVAPLFFVSIAGVGYAVRKARIRVDRDGVRWGWSWGGFRMPPERIDSVLAYTDAYAFKPKRTSRWRPASTWYLSRRDWDRFDNVAAALRSSGMRYERFDHRAPIGARLQSYGIVLDLLLVFDALAATFALVMSVLI